MIINSVYYLHIFSQNKHLNCILLVTFGVFFMFYFEMFGTRLDIQVCLFKSHSIAYYIIQPFIFISPSIAIRFHSIAQISRDISAKLYTIAQHEIVNDMHEMTVRLVKKIHKYVPNDRQLSREYNYLCFQYVPRDRF